MYSASLMMFKSSSRKLGQAWVTSLTGQTQPTPAQITFSITHGEGRVWWCLAGFCVLCCDCRVDNLIGYGHMTLSWPQHVKPLNWKTNVAKFVTHASTYSINDFVKHFPCDFQHLMHFMCTQKPAERHRTLSSHAWYWKWSALGLVGSGLWDYLVTTLLLLRASSPVQLVYSLIVSSGHVPQGNCLFLNNLNMVCYVCCDWDY